MRRSCLSNSIGRFLPYLCLAEGCEKFSYLGLALVQVTNQVIGRWDEDVIDVGDHLQKIQVYVFLIVHCFDKMSMVLLSYIPNMSVSVTYD